MISMLRRERITGKKIAGDWRHRDDKIMVYQKGKVLFAFNFHPTKSFEGYFIPVEEAGDYQVILTTDDGAFGGYDNIDKNYRYTTQILPDGRKGIYCYLPTRTAMVLKKV